MMECWPPAPLPGWRVEPTPRREYWDPWCSIWLKNNTVHGVNKPWIEKTTTEDLEYLNHLNIALGSCGEFQSFSSRRLCSHSAMGWRHQGHAHGHPHCRSYLWRRHEMAPSYSSDRHSRWPQSRRQTLDCDRPQISHVPRGAKKSDGSIRLPPE